MIYRICLTFSRGLKDDYLLACAVIGRADHIVVGDDELLVLKEVEGVKIVGARKFWGILGEE